MQDPDKKDGYLATAAAKPSLLLKGENPPTDRRMANCAGALGCRPNGC